MLQILDRTVIGSFVAQILNQKSYIYQNTHLVPFNSDW